MNELAVTLGTVLAGLVVAVLKFIFDRRDRKKEETNHVKDHPDNPDGLARFRDWVRDKTNGHF